MKESYDALYGKVAKKLDDLDFQIVVRGRYFMAEAYYLGSHAIIQVGDKVLVLGNKGAKILIAPIIQDAFI